jgi:hypothetical protein
MFVRSRKLEKECRNDLLLALASLRSCCSGRKNPTIAAMTMKSAETPIPKLNKAEPINTSANPLAVNPTTAPTSLFATSVDAFTSQIIKSDCDLELV